MTGTKRASRRVVTTRGFTPEISPFIKLFTRRSQLREAPTQEEYDAAPWWEQTVFDGGEKIVRSGSGEVQLSGYPDRFMNSLIIAISSTSLVLGLLAEPDGLLLAAGIEPPVTVSQEAWSLFANVIGYLLVAAFFVIEYAYRRQRFPRQPYRNILDFLLRVLAAMPRLVSNASGSHRMNSGR